MMLDEQAKQDAKLIAAHFNLNGISAAIRYALREMARRIIETDVAANVAGKEKEGD